MPARAGRVRRAGRHRHGGRRAGPAVDDEQRLGRPEAGREPGEAPQHRGRDARRLLHGPRADDAVGAADAQGGRELPALLRHRLAVLRLALELLHRAVPPPDRRTHQHLQPGHLEARRLAGLRRQRQPRARLQRAPAGGRLHHRLRRQVPQRVRVVARSCAAARGAGLVDLQHRLRLGLRRLGLRQHLVAGQRLRLTQHPAPPASASAAAKDRAYAGTVIGDLAMDFLRSGEASDAPYFLEVALYAPHNRVNQQGHYADDPLFPPMFRDRSGPRSCGRVACRKLHHRRPARLRRPAQGQPARAWPTASGPARGTPRVRSPRPSRSATCATARGWPAPPTGW